MHLPDQRPRPKGRGMLGETRTYAREVVIAEKELPHATEASFAPRPK
jgi:hypothetical protein